MQGASASRLPSDRAFERLRRRHVAAVYRYAFAVLDHESDAEDIAQATFANAYRAFQLGERPRSPHNWLLAIAHDLCRRRCRGVHDADDGEASPAAADVRRALAQLTFSERAALAMREVEQRSCAEIAAILELPVPAVESLLFEARRALRKQLEGTLACVEAERAISRLADGCLTRSERAALRAHVRSCLDCTRLARGVRVQRSAFRNLAELPVPESLTRPAQVSLGSGI
jgi:RNA polymerase sigma factor (sigma-70 family)